MEILILISILAVGAAALYVAFTFSTRINNIIAPLLRNIANNISSQVEASDNKILTGQRKETKTAISAIRAELDEIKQSVEQINTAVRHGSLRTDLEKLNHQLGQLNRSVARQAEAISMLRKHAEDRELKEGGRSVMELESAMLEAEAYVARQGWGQPPQLFSLASKSSVVAADQELAGQLQDAGPDALIPVRQDELPAGQPLDVLASVHWPGEVLGCVLVTEIVILPPEAAKDAPNDPDTAEQWAAAQSAGREARLAVCVSRDGGHTCGLRLKDDDDVQVNAELADDLVALLLTTF